MRTIVQQFLLATHQPLCMTVASSVSIETECPFIHHLAHPADVRLAATAAVPKVHIHASHRLLHFLFDVPAFPDNRIHLAIPESVHVSLEPLQT